ncbi:MAG: TolC family protein [Ignavibacteriaceae bacterium]|jgi:Outer membrane protein|nr:MAG: TolC family protein [Chlorobiota bacterium]KXK05852.1 MAG: outer membrane protein [Chlorobi bacterium OLB4]MBV6398320.1 hypothetical protein [Ignavibacteria bacterium]MCE7952659.1 TolC family protein [Chlorobi bacterium CHB7]MDL1886771.1 TolC family protein [Ignavibacteria bacterium CHB1]MEB2329561.1 TolC family protein [Ignavibacteriaceae bacterium]OQY77800.1 MAG: hypothetical protein B6D43_04640 [Ignavibacteriales bacterium UTCHB1]RIK50296.1 MAG: hypothetical protein DCC60_00410 [I
MYKLIRIIFTICIFLNPEVILPQTIKVLTLTEAINLATENNNELVTARLEQVKAEEKVSEVYRDNLAPNFVLSSRYSRNFKKPTFNIFGETFEIGADNELVNTLEIQYSIPVLGVPVFQGIRVAEYYQQLSETNVKNIKNSVIAQVKKSFYATLLAKEIVEVNKQSLENSKNNLSVVESRYKNGIATEFDYLRAKVQVENIKPAVEKSISDLNVSKLRLKDLIGLREEDEIEITGNLEYDSSEIFRSTEEILNSIISNNSGLIALDLNRKINLELVRVNEANYLPKLAIFGQYQLSASENDNNSITNWKFNNAVIGGLALSWDLNIFRTQKVVSQSLIDVRINEEQIENLRNKLRLSGESIILRLENARSRIIAQEENVKLAQRGLDLANISFREGILNQLDVLNAELQLSQSKLAYLQAVYDYQIAKTELEELLEN